jgi:ribosomal protein L12E/L44/L45/RPP1/RPP2
MTAGLADNSTAWLLAWSRLAAASEAVPPRDPDDDDEDEEDEEDEDEEDEPPVVREPDE